MGQRSRRRRVRISPVTSENRYLFEKARDDFGLFAMLIWTTEDGAPLNIREPFHGELMELGAAWSRGIMTEAAALALWRRPDRFAIEPGAPFVKACVLAPPGLGKSTWLVRALASWDIGRNPRLRCGIGSGDKTLAVEFSMSIRNKMLSPEYRAVFPAVRMDPAKKWTHEAWYVDREGQEDEASPTVTAFGADCTLRGERFDRLYLDDMIDRETCQSAYQREKRSKTIRMEVFSRMTPGARMLNLGNRIHMLDWHGELIADGWPTLERRALFPVGAPECDMSVEDMLASGAELAALAPSIFPVDAELARRKDATPPIYEASYQQRAREASEGKYIRRRDLRYAADDPAPPYGVQIGVAIDCAMSAADERQDRDTVNRSFTVFLFGYRDDRRRLVLFDMYRERVGFSDQVRNAAELARLWTERGHDVLLAIELEKGGKALKSMLEEELADDDGIDFEEGLTPVADKVTRASELIRQIEDGRVRFAPLFRRHEDEIVSFPRGLTDIVDAGGILARLELRESDIIDEAMPDVYGDVDEIADLDMQGDSMDISHGKELEKILNDPDALMAD